METVPHTHLQKPFGKIRYTVLPDGSKEVWAYLLQEHIREGAQTGVGLQASRSMRRAYGLAGWRGLLGRQAGTNYLSPVAQRMCAYLARKIDADRSTTVVYWAVGRSGEEVLPIGELTTFAAEQHLFAGPERFGDRAMLLPAVRYFVERFTGAPWGMYVFLTDGRVDDLAAVKEYSSKLAQEIQAGRRNPLKMVLIGLGAHVDVGVLQQLDDLSMEGATDLWDYKLSAEMRGLLDIFAEVVDENRMVAKSGVVRDPAGEIVADYRAKGVPGLIRLRLPAKAAYFTLETEEGVVFQPVR